MAKVKTKSEIYILLVDKKNAQLKNAVHTLSRAGCKTFADVRRVVQYYHQHGCTHISHFGPERVQILETAYEKMFNHPLVTAEEKATPMQLCDRDSILMLSSTDPNVTRCVKSLHRAGYKKIGDVRELSQQSLMELEGFGPVSISLFLNAFNEATETKISE